MFGNILSLGGLSEDMTEFLTEFFENGGKIQDLFPDDERVDDDDDDDFASDDNDEEDEDEEVGEDEDGSNLDAVDDEAEEAGEVGQGDDSEDEMENILENACPDTDFDDGKFRARNE